MRLLASLLLVLFLALPARAGQPLVFGYIGAPLSYSSLAVLKAAYARLGIDVTGRTLPAARALELSAMGATDGEVHRIAAIAGEHPQLIRVEVSINRVEGLALSCGRSIDTSRPDAIRDYRIGIKIGTRYAERLTEGMPDVTHLPDEDKLMEMLLAGRLDIVIGDRPWALMQSGPGRECVRINEPPLVVIPLYHYLHMRHHELVPRITAVLREMERTGEIQAVARRALDELRIGADAGQGQ